MALACHIFTSLMNTNLRHTTTSSSHNPLAINTTGTTSTMLITLAVLLVGDLLYENVVTVIVIVTYIITVLFIVHS